MKVDGYIHCRTFGHGWDDVSGVFKPKTVTFLTGIRIAVRCVNCATERHEVWSRETFQLLSRQYIYPLDYKLAPTEGVTRRQSARSAYFSASTKKKRIAR